MKTNKLLIVALAAMLALSLSLAACGDKEEKPNDTDQSAVTTSQAGTSDQKSAETSVGDTPTTQAGETESPETTEVSVENDAPVTTETPVTTPAVTTTVAPVTTPAPVTTTAPPVTAPPVVNGTVVKADTEFVSKGSTWKYYVIDTEGFKNFESTNTNWMTSSFNDGSWKSGAAPFGDRVTGQNSSIGWGTGDGTEPHGLFLRTTFNVSDVSDIVFGTYKMNIFYDNTIKIYLNGTLIFEAAGWNDEYQDIALKDLTPYLVDGTNQLAVSLLDETGGREFDMNLTASYYTSNDATIKQDEKISLGSAWNYALTNTDGFDAFNASTDASGNLWNSKNYKMTADWKYDASLKAPYGDRVTGQNSNIGWGTGEDTDPHGLFLRKTFTVSDPADYKNGKWLINTFYDNTIYIYINGQLVYSHDANGGNGDWTEGYAVFELANVENLLVSGENTVAISLKDGWGGREFDLGLYAVYSVK